MGPISQRTFGLESGSVSASVARLLSVLEALFQKQRKVSDRRRGMADPANG
jgi:hypothetical protein